MLLLIFMNWAWPVTLTRHYETFVDLQLAGLQERVKLISFDEIIYEDLKRFFYIMELSIFG